MPAENQFFLEGQQYYNDGRYAEAIPLLEAAAEADPEYLWSYYYLAKSHLFVKNEALAIRYFSKLIESKEALVSGLISDCYDGLAICHLQRKELSRANEYCALAIQANPDNLSAKHNQALVYLEYLKYEAFLSGMASMEYQRKCEALLTDILQRDPTHCHALHSMASLYKFRKDLESALHYYIQAKLHCPATDKATKDTILYNLAECYAQIGHAHYKADDFQSARSYYEKALGENKGHYVAQSQLGMCFYQLKNYVKAQEYFDELTTITTATDEEKADALMNSAACLRELKKYVRAQKALDEAQKLAPDDKTLPKEQETLRDAAATSIQVHVRGFLGKIHQENGNLQPEMAVSEFTL